MLDPFVISGRVRTYRQAYLADRAEHAVGYALYLNKAAIRLWPDREGPGYFDDAIAVLQSANASCGRSSERLPALARILHNSAQLRAFEAVTGSDELHVALDHSAAASDLSRRLLQTVEDSPFAGAQHARDEAVERACVLEATHVRVLAATGQLGDATDRADTLRQGLLKQVGRHLASELDSVLARELAPLRDPDARWRPAQRMWLWLGD